MDENSYEVNLSREIIAQSTGSLSISVCLSLSILLLFPYVGFYIPLFELLFWWFCKRRNNFIRNVCYAYSDFILYKNWNKFLKKNQK